MKKLISRIFFVAFGALALVSCNNDNDPNDGRFGNDPQSGWIQFPLQNTTYIVSGLVTEFTVQVSLEAPVNTDGLEFTYTIQDVQGSTDGYINRTGTGIVPKNSRSGFITFTLPNTSLTSCKEFDIKLTGTNRPNVQVGLNNMTEKPITHRVLVGKGISTYLGNYSVLEGTYTYQTEIIAGEAANEIVIRKFSDYDPASLTSIFFTPISTDYPQLSFGEANTYLFTAANPAIGDVFIGNVIHEGEDPAEHAEHLSFYDPCTGGLSIYFGLFDSTDSPLDEMRDVFTKLP